MNIIYPISFDNGVCPHCCSKGYLKHFDKYGHQTNFDLYSVSTIKCDKCGTEFFIRWNKNSEDDDYRYYPISFDIINTFEKNIIEYSKKNARDISLEKYNSYNEILKIKATNNFEDDN